MKQSFDMNRHTYIIDDRLKAVVEVAITLGMPLLLTGEPGTGKTKLANYVAEKMLGTDLLTFNTKTTSQAQDLLYQYNALTHFRDSRTGGEGINTMEYITFQALGKAIVESPEKQQVVLIDEIDKAPRDFPNDVLFEFENKAFKINEASVSDVKQYSKTHLKLQPDDEGFFRLPKNSEHNPVLIITSNSEKNLPDAFLRRCVFYHIPFPKPEKLEKIVHGNVELSESFTDAMLSAAVKHFIDIRENGGLRKKPATAELMAWIHILKAEGLNVDEVLKENGNEKLIEKILKSYAVLSKSEDDFELLKQKIKAGE